MDFPYVREWDFKSFFDTLDLNKLKELMIGHGIPSVIAYQIKSINESIIKLPSPEERKINEDRAEEKRKAREEIIKKINLSAFTTGEEFVESLKSLVFKGLDVQIRSNALFNLLNLMTLYMKEEKEEMLDI